MKNIELYEICSTLNALSQFQDVEHLRYVQEEIINSKVYLLRPRMATSSRRELCGKIRRAVRILSVNADEYISLHERVG